MASWLDEAEKERNRDRERESASWQAKLEVARQFYQTHAADIEKVLQEAADYLNRRYAVEDWVVETFTLNSSSGQYNWSLSGQDPNFIISVTLVTTRNPPVVRGVEMTPLTVEIALGHVDRYGDRIPSRGRPDHSLHPDQFSIALVKREILAVFRSRNI